MPPSLYNGAGGALREAYRHFFTATVKAWAAMMVSELNEKLEQTIVLRFPEIAQADIAARSRSFNSLRQGGATFDSAAATTGLHDLVEEPDGPPADV